MPTKPKIYIDQKPINSHKFTNLEREKTKFSSFMWTK